MITGNGNGGDGMKRTTSWRTAAVAAALLSGCVSSAAPVPLDVPTAILQAHVDNPELATQLVPGFHLNPFVRRTAAPVAPASTSILLPVADLETAYETSFCQLNDARGVTMQSPQCLANIAYIRLQSGTGWFDLAAKPVLNNPVGVTGVLFQPVNYSTKVMLPQGEATFAVSGGLMLPQGISGAKLKGVVTYFHGTTFDKAMVGSNYDGSGETRLLAEVFASQGYVVVIPDYVGQGADWQNVHPYVLYPQVSAKTAVDMLAAVAPTIRAQYPLDAGAQLKLFSAGYSEGGAYSLWLSIFLNQQPATLDPLYRMTHSVGMEGAYSTSTVTKGFLFDDVAQLWINPYNIQTQAITNLVKPLLSADAFLSYATYQLNGDVASVFHPDFYALRCTSPLPQTACNVGGQNVEMAAAFARASTNVAAPVLSSALRKSANGATYPGDLLLSSKNGIASLVSPAILGASGQAQLDAALRAADVNLAGLPDQAVSIITLDQDSVVTPNNYQTLLAAYPTKIRRAHSIPASKIQVVSPFSYYVQKTPYYVDVDHMQGLAYEFLYALHIFNQLAE